MQAGNGRHRAVRPMKVGAIPLQFFVARVPQIRTERLRSTPRGRVPLTTQ
jgi:hypothetical protein